MEITKQLNLAIYEHATNCEYTFDDIYMPNKRSDNIDDITKCLKGMFGTESLDEMLKNQSMSLKINVGTGEKEFIAILHKDMAPKSVWDYLHYDIDEAFLGKTLTALHYTSQYTFYSGNTTSNATVPTIAAHLAHTSKDRLAESVFEDNFGRDSTLNIGGAWPEINSSSSMNSFAATDLFAEKCLSILSDYFVNTLMGTGNQSNIARMIKP